MLANVSAATAAVSRSIEDVQGAAAAEANANERRAKLGALDSVLISPTRLPLHLQQLKRSDVDTRKIAAILRERSPLELQRHLITTTVHNQVSGSAPPLTFMQLARSLACEIYHHLPMFARRFFKSD